MPETPLHIPAAWQHSAARILAKNWRRVLVVGAADRGKSIYCNFLVNALLRVGRTASFVDADIGQKDVGPPATVALAELDASAALAQARCNALYFVGHINPIAHFLPLVLGTRLMVEAARGEFVVIDTTGLVQGKGRVLKGFQIESLQPDVLVCLELGEELAPIRHAARHLNILRLRPSRLAAQGLVSIPERDRDEVSLSCRRPGARAIGRGAPLWLPGRAGWRQEVQRLPAAPSVASRSRWRIPR
jgi:polynucleotide 5'-hydroxyl-kinase GRC3/NOL9